MGMMFDLLPLLNAWEYRVIDEEESGIPAGGTYNLALEEKELGWILSASIRVMGENAEKTSISIKADGLEFDTTFERLYQAGHVETGVMTPYLSRYDTVDNVFEVVFAFAYPMPYKSLLRSTIHSPSENSILFDGEVSTIRIKRGTGMKEKFEESLRRVLGTEQMVELYGEKER